MRLLMLLLVLGEASLSIAHAQSTSPDSAEGEPDPDAAAAEGEDGEARRLFDEGREALRAGDYELALRDFTRSYELSGLLALLYNIGVANERLGRDQAMLDSYEQFLAGGGEVANRGDLERRMTLARERIAASEPDGSNAHPATPAEEEIVIPWVVASLSGAVMVTGAVLLAIGLLDVHAIDGSPPESRSWLSAQADGERAFALQIAGAVLAGAGALGLGVGIAWGATSGGGPHGEVALSPLGLSARGSF